MTFSFNLIDQPWIPCLRTRGAMEDMSLRETLIQAHELSAVQGDSPLETAALYRLLLAILHSALRGPRSRAEWADLWQAGKWDVDLLDLYFNQWHHRFDLFDPQRPFYQAEDDRVKAKSVTSLVFEMASGNNAVLFDHHTEAEGVSLPAAKAARTLIAAQSFSLAGLSPVKENFTDSPWSRGVIFLMEGDNLFCTLALNLLRFTEYEPMPNLSLDQPAWEMADPFQPARHFPNGYLDYLTWQNRKILLIPEGSPTEPIVRNMTASPGLRLDASVLDPMKHYRVDSERGNLVLRFSEGRALWRDSAALLHLEDDRAVRPPATFHFIARLVEDELVDSQQLYRFMALGMANDQAKVEFFREEHLPLPLPYLKQSALVSVLSAALTLAEQCRSALWNSISLMALLVISPKSDGKTWKDIDRISKEQAAALYNHWAVERYYWSGLEIPFLALLRDLPEDALAINTWEETVRSAAWRSFERAEKLAGVDTQALKSAVRARTVLVRLLKELFKDKEAIA